MKFSLDLLLAASPAPADLPDKLAAAIRERGSDKALLRRCMAAVAPGDAAAGLAWAAAVQDATAEPLYAVLAEIAALEGEEAPRHRFGARLAETAADSFAALARAFDDALDGRPIDPAHVRLITAGHGPAMSWLRFVMPAPHMLSLLKPNKLQAIELENSGLAVGALREFIAGWMRPMPEWAAVLDAAALPSEEARARVLQAEAEVGWVDRALAEGGVTMVDPIDGRVLKAEEGFFTGGRPSYLFRGVEPFFLITGGPWNAPQGLYMPRRGIVISFDGESRGQLRGEALASRMNRFMKRKAAPVAPPADPPPGPTLYLPTVDNFAHQLWNFQTGIERAIRLGLLGKIGAVRYAGTEFFGPLAEIFPELAGTRIERPKRDTGFDVADGDPTRLPLPATGYLLQRSLIDRVMAVARARPRGRPDAVEPADIPRDKSAPVVWIGLRVRGRAWVGQESGSIEVIRRLSARRPDTLFLLDGFSYPIGDDGSSHLWADAVAGLHAVAERIRAAAPDPARVVNMVGNTMRESCLWAQETDVYLAPYGSTQHKVAWFGDAPGLVYAPPAITEAQAARSCGFCAAEGSGQPRLLVGRPVEGPTQEIGPPRSYAPSNAYQDLDAAEVAELLWSLLEPRLAAREAAAVAAPAAATAPASPGGAAPAAKGRVKAPPAPPQYPLKKSKKRRAKKKS